MGLLLWSVISFLDIFITYLQEKPHDSNFSSTFELYLLLSYWLKHAFRIQNGGATQNLVHVVENLVLFS